MHACMHASRARGDQALRQASCTHRHTLLWACVPETDTQTPGMNALAAWLEHVPTPASQVTAIFPEYENKKRNLILKEISFSSFENMPNPKVKPKKEPKKGEKSKPKESKRSQGNPKERIPLKVKRTTIEHPESVRMELFKPDKVTVTKEVQAKKDTVCYDRFLIFDLSKAPGTKGYNPIKEVHIIFTSYITMFVMIFLRQDLKTKCFAY